MYRIMDPFEGVWHLLLYHDAIFGIYGEIDDGMLEKVISNIINQNTGKTG
jgi:hypothetical protein